MNHNATAKLQATKHMRNDAIRTILIIILILAAAVTICMLCEHLFNKEDKGTTHTANGQATWLGGISFIINDNWPELRTDAHIRADLEELLLKRREWTREQIQGKTTP